MRKQIKILIGVLAFIFISEVSLRLFFGFCDAILFRSDLDYEYIAQPNQNRYRFRHQINYNSNSMRSEEVDKNASVILGLGDSVINGGVLTDQKELATTILSDTLSKLKSKRVQFLNISAGSWGPDNCYAFIKKHGTFNAEEIYLFVSSHDAYDNMDFEVVVGEHLSYPSKQNTLALYELLERYLLPKVKKKINKTDVNREKMLGINKKKSNSKFNRGFQDILNLTKQEKIPLTIYLHAEKKEVLAGEYNDQGQEIIEFANKNNIKLIKDLDYNIKQNEYRDGIHINAIGQRHLANNVLKSLF